MKLLLCILLLPWGGAQASYNGLLERADEQWARRDFTADGRRSAEDARYNYERVGTRLMASVEGQYANARYLRANHFIGTTADSDRAKTLMNGFAAGQRALLWFEGKWGRGPLPRLGERERKIYAEVVAYHAFNLKDWIRESGGGYSGEWKKAETLVQQVVDAGLDYVSEWAPRRLLAERAMETGNTTQARQHLEAIFQNTKAGGISRIGFVNFHLAELLGRAGENDRARTLLREFADAPLGSLSFDLEPENRRYQAMARERLRGARPKAVPGEYVVKLSGLGRLFASFSGMDVKEELAPGILLVRSPDGVATASSFVEVMEPNYLYWTSRDANDPGFAESWGLKNSGQLDSKGSKGVAGVDVRASAAWEISKGKPTVVVAVIDTGVDFTHPDLAHAAWVNEKEASGRAGVDDDGNGYVDDVNGWDFLSNKPASIDDHGHGTHVAGVIAAQGDNGQGTAGVAWNVKIMALKFLGANGGGSLSEAIKAIQYASRMGAVITNNSWGSGENSKILRDVIEGASGSLFVAAAGNSGENADLVPEYPSAYDVPHIVSVASVDNRGRLSNFSNWGPRSVDIAAPGQNILSSLPGGKYEAWSGTSMAAPFVAGTAALLVSENPGMAPLEMKKRMMATASPLVALRGKTASGGMVNARNALTGEVSPEDPNDPGKWEERALSLVSARPYSPDTDQIFEVRIPGAKQVAIDFELFQTELGYDRAVFYDGAGNRIGVWTGDRSREWSPSAEGEAILVRFVSDHRVEAAGFSAVRAAARF
ncbi:MAG: S8 family serine peptidase [Bdellovibrionales bacterium]|nr:S8 family serine peptidase [Bdellovibrionales bacterium]